MRKVLFFIVALLTAATAWADVVTLSEDNDFAVGTAGHWYVNMPKTGTNTLTLTDASVTTFKVYDDGGKSEDYSNYCDGTLVLTVPAGYVIQLSGTVESETRKDKLTVYDNSEASGTKLIDGASSRYLNCAAYIPPVCSSGQSVTFYFYSDIIRYEDGIDLTVTLVNPNESHNITMNNPTVGGTISSNKTTAKPNNTVTLTSRPSTGYLLNDLTVKDASNNSLAVTDMLWYTGATTATFTMAGSAVTVTPTFINTLTAEGGLYVNMPSPSTSTKQVIIPAGVQSFKVYDDGGKDEYYSDYCRGTLVLTAPTGYVLQLSGSVTLQQTYDYLTVYDGGDNTADKLIDAAGSVVGNRPSPIPTVTSSGQSMTLYFYSNGATSSHGLDLTVTVVNPNAASSITVNTATGGSVSSDKETAELDETVTLTARPSTGYVLNDLTVKDASNNSVAVTDMLWYTGTATATFSMPPSAVTVTPTFTNTLTADGGLYVNMPTTGTKQATIPAGVQSFKVYDDGGKSGKYSYPCDGTLVLTAPIGHVLMLSGNISIKSDFDFLTVYDNSEASGTKLINAFSSTGSAALTAIPIVTSSGRSMTIYFESHYSYATYDGLDLKVTVVPSNNDFTMSGDEYTIHTATGWDAFCNYLEAGVTFSGKTVTLADNITVSRMAGSGAGGNLTASDRPFCGTFDGGGKTLTFNYGSSGTPADENNIAPFRYVNNATIQHLHVAGNIYTQHVHAGGIVGMAYGTSNITDCISSVNIVSSINGDGTHGGIMSCSWTGSTTNITGCLFDGSIQSAEGYATDQCGGFVGWRNATINVTDCLLDADLSTIGVGTGDYPSATFVRHGEANRITNSYYTAALGTPQGKQTRSITAGENVTTLENAGAPSTVYNVSGITAYPTGIKYNDVLYAGNSDTVSLALGHSDIEGYAFNGYEASAGTLSGSANPYTLIMPDEDVTLTALYETAALRGDVNGDNQVSIGDVTALIDYLLSSDASGINLTNADCNQDDGVSIADVTALIDYLLSGNWN